MGNSAASQILLGSKSTANRLVEKWLTLYNPKIRCIQCIDYIFLKSNEGLPEAAPSPVVLLGVASDNASSKEVLQVADGFLLLM